MCPLCDETCDFWYYASSCSFVRGSLLFDYGGTVFFAIFMTCWGMYMPLTHSLTHSLTHLLSHSLSHTCARSLSLSLSLSLTHSTAAVLYMEFWKRTEASLQYEWDTLGYEAAEERERPEFIQSIKRKIKNYPEEKKKQYKIYNVVLERYEYIQPTHIFIPKVVAAFSILITMVAAVIGIVIAVLFYRIAISTLIYRAVRTFPGGPSVADLTVSITGSLIQLVFIIIMNQIYERLASWLTSWGKRERERERRRNNIIKAVV